MNESLPTASQTVQFLYSNLSSSNIAQLSTAITMHRGETVDLKMLLLGAVTDSLGLLSEDNITISDVSYAILNNVAFYFTPISRTVQREIKQPYIIKNGKIKALKNAYNYHTFLRNSSTGVVSEKTENQYQQEGVLLLCSYNNPSNTVKRPLSNTQTNFNFAWYIALNIIV